MIKKNLTKILISSVIILLPVLAGLILWDKLPAEVPTHFGPDGKADGYSSKAFAVFFLPIFMLAMHLICTFATSLDPKHKNISNKPFALVLWICPVLSVLVSALMYLTALGYAVNVTVIMMFFTAGLFVIIGNYLPKCRQNYTIGIKLPWTLNDEENWNATHRFAGKLWVAGGIILACFAFFKFAWIVFIAVIFVMVIIPTLYSYFYDKKRNS